VGGGGGGGGGEKLSEENKKQRGAERARGENWNLLSFKANFGGEEIGASGVEGLLDDESARSSPEKSIGMLNAKGELRKANCQLPRSKEVFGEKEPQETVVPSGFQN